MKNWLMHYLVIILVFSIPLRSWYFQTNGTVEELCFEKDGTLAAASYGGCLYVFTFSGSLLKRTCVNEPLISVDCSPTYVIAGSSNNMLYLFDAFGKLVKDIKVDVYPDAVRYVNGNILICGKGACELLNVSDGHVIWKVAVGYVISRPALYGNNAIIADLVNDSIIMIDLENGNVTKRVYLGEDLYSVDVCYNYLAVAGRYHVYLYKLPDLELLWLRDLNGWGVAFAPGCSELAVSDPSSRSLMIFNYLGEFEGQISVGDVPYGIDSWGLEYAVGTNSGGVYVYLSSQRYPVSFLLVLAIPALRLLRSPRRPS